MPNIKSQKDRVRLSEKQTVRNKMLKTALRTQLKKANASVDSNSADKDALVKVASIALDKSVTKGIMHRNTASRRISRLAKRSNKAGAQA